MTTTRNAGWTLPGPRRTPGFHDAGIFEVAPLVCVVLTMLVTMYMLYATGFLEACADGKVLEEFSWAFEKPDGSLIETENVATRRGGLALSGVLLAATVVLSLTALLWVYANRTKLWDARGLRKTIIQGFVLCSLVATTLLYWHPFIGGDISFVSSLSWALLETTRTQMPEATWLAAVPLLMYWLGALLPLILAFGACLFLQPVACDNDLEGCERCLSALVPRLRELDYMLYMGALALVCGTLQLSVSLSIPLARMPSAADVKTTIELCKTPATPGTDNPFLSPATGASQPEPETPARPFHRGFSLADCAAVPTELARVNVATSVRSLIHSLTLSFGLAFSLMLAAIYFPAMLQLREWTDRSRAGLRHWRAQARAAALAAGAQPAAEGSDELELAESEPTRRIVAVLATLGPIIAGLAANTLTSD